MNKTITLIALIFNLGLYAQPGATDSTFKSGMGANSHVFSILLQSDGKIVIGGDFTTYNDTARKYIARLNTDGTLDTNFDSGTGADENIYCMALQSDGKILVGGFFKFYNGMARGGIARLNTDGTLDTTFDSGTGVDGYVSCVAQQSDGKILIGGYFNAYNGTVRNGIVRLNANGSLDNSFNPNGIGSNLGVRNFALLSDEKIIIVGNFTAYNGSTRYRIARLKTDGTLDGTFNPLLGANGSIISVAIQSDEKIIIGGDFTTFRGTPRNRIARLNKDCSLDTTFNPGTGANDLVLSIAPQNDGKIVIGGSFTSYNGTERNRIDRISWDGSLDTAFNPDTGASGNISAIALQSDGKILIGGNFLYYNDSLQYRIARLNGDATTGVNTLNSLKSNITIYPNPANNFISIKLNPGTQQAAYTIANQLGQSVLSGILTQENNTVDVTTLTTGIYFFKSGENNSHTLKIIKQ